MYVCSTFNLCISFPCRLWFQYSSRQLFVCVCVCVCVYLCCECTVLACMWTHPYVHNYYACMSIGMCVIRMLPISAWMKSANRKLHYNW